MLEILVSVRKENKIDKDGFIYKKPGDIIVAKISPAVWSETEKKQFLITYLDDPIIEARLKCRQEWKKDNTLVQVYPYKKVKEFEFQGEKIDVVVNKSMKRVKLDIDFKSKIKDIRDKTKNTGLILPDEKPNLVISDLISESDDRENQKMVSDTLKFATFNRDKTLGDKPGKWQQL